VSGDAQRPDNIVFDIGPAGSAGGFGHAHCGSDARNESNLHPNGLRKFRGESQKRPGISGVLGSVLSSRSCRPRVLPGPVAHHPTDNPSLSRARAHACRAGP
jgi:hypothetical protein